MLARRKLDVRGEICPYPVIHALRELRKMENEQILEVVTDHLLSVENVPAVAENEGHEVLEVSKIDVDAWKIRIKVKKRYERGELRAYNVEMGEPGLSKKDLTCYNVGSKESDNRSVKLTKRQSTLFNGIVSLCSVH